MMSTDGVINTPTPAPAGLCESCRLQTEHPYGSFQSLASEELPRSHRVAIRLGPLSEILSRQDDCKFCGLVISAISAAWNLSPPPTAIDGVAVECMLSNRVVGVVRKAESDLKYSENFQANDYRYTICRLVVHCKPVPPGYPFDIEIQATDSGPGIKGLFDDAPLFSQRPSNRLQSIDFNLLRRWLSHCNLSHGQECQRDSIPTGCHDAYVDSFRLIDVLTKQVVDAKPGESYVALSYVWGQAPMLKLVRSNRKDLYCKGALAEVEKNVPRTIQDAIRVVEKLEMQYLWVDALCIMQDDSSEKAKVIGEMDLIYSRAALTLVAASGSNADAGMAGLEIGDRKSGVFENVVIMPNTNYQFTVTRSRPSDVIALSPWNSRGWTYQERICSHRMLLFTDQQVLYMCGTASWCEESVLESDDPLVHYEQKQLYRLNLPNNETRSFMKAVSEASDIGLFQEYCKLVDEYSRRNLSFLADIQDAFTGALRRFQVVCEKQGAALNFRFGMPMRWPEMALLWTHLNKSHKKRRRLEKCKSAMEIEIPFPSWSWMGWIGAVKTSDYQRVLRSEIKWYYMNPNTCSLEHLPSEVLEKKRPSGLESSTSPRVLRDQWVPADASTEIHQADVASFNLQDFGGKLLFYTSIAMLPLARNTGDRITTYSANYLFGEKCQGWIHVDVEWVTTHPHGLFEFIVIARHMYPDFEDPGKCDGLMVMLVERHEGIAYRVAIGSVREDVWVKEKLRWDLVILG